jgi:A/G-specific adenine glycosylase
LTSEIPVKPAKKERRIEERTILLIEYQDRYAIRKRPDTGLLAKLWELPGLTGSLTIEELTKLLKELGVSESEIKSMGKAKHIFSHVEWHMLGYHIRLSEEPHREEFHRLIGRWANREEINETYSIPNAFSAFTGKLKDNKDI